MIRIGVLGCGYFGAEFARAVKEMKGIQLAAVYSPGKSSERLSSELGCPRSSSVNEIMENADIDAVIIATPNYLHHQHVLAAAEAGKHIFCEKPFALDAGEAVEMVEACRKAKVTLMVGHIMHFYHGIARVQAMILEGLFGDILTMHIERTGWEQKRCRRNPAAICFTIFTRSILCSGLWEYPRKCTGQAVIWDTAVQSLEMRTMCSFLPPASEGMPLQHYSMVPASGWEIILSVSTVRKRGR